MEHKTIKAEEGKVFRRISDGVVFGNEITLGYTYYINGVKLDKPYLETEDDFEQIDDENSNIEYLDTLLETIDNA